MTSKLTTIALLLLVFIVTSCSTNSTTSDNESQIFNTSTINYAVNGVDKYFTTIGGCCCKIDNTFTVNTTALAPEVIGFSFDKEGRFGYLKIDLNTGTNTVTSKFYTSNGYSSHYFNFNIISIDEVNNRIKGNFSGYLYSDPLNTNSEQKYVSGNFDLYYFDVVPIIPRLKNTCKIAAVDWVKTNNYIVKGQEANSGNVTEHNTSDNEYKIMVNYNQYNIIAGTYNFTETSPTNMIQLAKFDIVSGQYINYNCTGTLNVLKKEYMYGVGGDFVLKGTYSLTATNPNNSSDVIQVTDGDFKLLYINF